MGSSKTTPGHQGLGQTIGGAIDGAIGMAIGSVGRVLGSALHLPGMRHPSRARRRAPGSPAGIETMPHVDTPPPPGAIAVNCIDYSPARIHHFEVSDLAAFLAQPRPEWCAVRWVNVNGLHPNAVNLFKQHFGFHTLAAEDALHVPQRPKAEHYKDHYFIVTRMLTMADGHLHSEQVSMFLFGDTLITFQEHPGDIWQPIRDRLNIDDSRVRENDASFLAYALLDAIVDHCFPILEHYGDALEDMEDIVAGHPTTELLQRLHAIKRELVMLRRVIWPTRELVDALHRDEHGGLSKIAQIYMRDVYDHSVQIIDIIETYREMASGLTELYMSAISNRMNEIMKVLTIMASLFIPVTFIAGVYGMNFEHIPELKWRYAYFGFWTVCAVITGGLLLYFRRKGWIGRS